MVIRELAVRFLTPAFLGNAEQSGQWRTPPFKHLLREWWRVAYIAGRNFNVRVDDLRQAEARLFGSAANGTGARSLVRLRLDDWSEGRLTGWQGEPTVRHPEVGDGGWNVGAHLYLGYGPLAYDRQTRQTVLKKNAAIQAGESATLRLAFPEEDADLLDQTLALADRLGALGGRSRNGWGSLRLEGDTPSLESFPLRDWQSCLDRDWPHAIGKDDRGVLIWQTRGHNDWRALMKTLAEIKIGFRTKLGFTTGRNAPRPEARHWIAYPVTNHSVAQWGSYRLPNSLRFKVRKTDDGQLAGMIFHMPHLPPLKANDGMRDTIESAWRKVHTFLDGTQHLNRVDG